LLEARGDTEAQAEEFEDESLELLESSIEGNSKKSKIDDEINRIMQRMNRVENNRKALVDDLRSEPKMNVNQKVSEMKSVFGAEPKPTANVSDNIEMKVTEEPVAVPQSQP